MGLFSPGTTFDKPFANDTQELGAKQNYIAATFTVAIGFNVLEKQDGVHEARRYV